MEQIEEQRGCKEIALLRPPGCYIKNEFNRYIDWLSQFGNVTIIMFDEMIDSFPKSIDLLVVPDYGVNWNRVPIDSKTVMDFKTNSLANIYYSYLTVMLNNLGTNVPIIYLGFSGVDILCEEGAKFHFNKSPGRVQKFPVYYEDYTSTFELTVMGIDYVSFISLPKQWQYNCTIISERMQLTYSEKLPLIWKKDNKVIFLYNPVYLINRKGSFIFDKTGHTIGDYPSYNEIIKCLYHSETDAK
jgi:hypothetical protein